MEEDISAYEYLEGEKEDLMAKRVENFAYQQMRDQDFADALRRLHRTRRELGHAEDSRASSRALWPS